MYKSCLEFQCQIERWTCIFHHVLVIYILSIYYLIEHRSLNLPNEISPRITSCNNSFFTFSSHLVQEMRCVCFRSPFGCLRIFLSFHAWKNSSIPAHNSSLREAQWRCVLKEFFNFRFCKNNVTLKKYVSSKWYTR